jgi:hypothetical protein
MQGGLSEERTVGVAPTQAPDLPRQLQELRVIVRATYA